MYPIPDDLTPADKNKLNSYLPIRNKGNDFDWEIITGMVLGHALKKQVKQYAFEKFRSDCKTQFGSKLYDQDFWNVLDRMYFTSNAVFSISPLFLLFKAQRKGSGKTELGAANLRMEELFAGLMNSNFLLNEKEDKLNFIEQEMLVVLRSKLEKSTRAGSNEQPYLPFLAETFQQDIEFLSNHPQYLLQELTNTLKLYAFAYCSQLALNINGWKNGKPTSKRLYFILDTEKASSERVCQLYGYKMFKKASEDLFPMLSALEVMQHKDLKRPLWQVYQDAIQYPDQQSLLKDLNRYLQAFIESRSLSALPASDSIEAAFHQLEVIAIQQFRDEKTTRNEINEKYTKELEKQICGDFIQSRGRAGQVLVLNQDQLLLLTNLAIGNNEKMRLHELIGAFERRGFYLDAQSQQMLVNFYERMGNVERMSDSGDAVYARKTV